MCGNCERLATVFEKEALRILSPQHLDHTGLREVEDGVQEAFCRGRGWVIRKAFGIRRICKGSAAHEEAIGTS